MPTTAEERLAIVENFVKAFNEAGIPLSDVYLDPLVKPVSVNNNFGMVLCL